MDGHFIIEQPGSSLFFHYLYIQEAFKLLAIAGLKAFWCEIVILLCCFVCVFSSDSDGYGNCHKERGPPPISFQLLAEVYKVGLWMRLWGAACPKRTILFSNGKAVKMLWTGALDRKKYPSLIQTATKYIDGAGKRRYKGSKELKSTQSLAWIIFTCSG